MKHLSKMLAVGFQMTEEEALVKGLTRLITHLISSVRSLTETSKLSEVKMSRYYSLLIFFER